MTLSALEGQVAHTGLLYLLRVSLQTAELGSSKVLPHSPGVRLNLRVGLQRLDGLIDGVARNRMGMQGKDNIVP